MRELTHFVSGRAVKGTSGRFAEVLDPNTAAVQAKCPLAKGEVEAVLADAAATQIDWGATNPQRRARVLMKWLNLINSLYTKTKTVTSRWPSGMKDGASFVIPTME